MSERSAELYARAMMSAKTAEEAWEDIKKRNKEIRWDVEAMLEESDLENE